MELLEELSQHHCAASPYRDVIFILMKVGNSPINSNPTQLLVSGLLFGSYPSIMDQQPPISIFITQWIVAPAGISIVIDGVELIKVHEFSGAG